jgi:uncharacterized protein with NAD-binding domain and iron-sulfur cluster
MLATPHENPLRVAIVGGGAAGLTAAFELTRPELSGRYQVTVFQRGWRLGGKGASGRGAGGRIEEHGLHIWMGFYENAFRLIRQCYEELGRDSAQCPIARWEDAFVPDPATGVMDALAQEAPAPWIAWFPPGAGTPGDASAQPEFGATDYLVRAAQLLQALLESAAHRSGEPPPEHRGLRMPESPAALLESVARALRYGQLGAWTALREAARVMPAALRAPGLTDAIPFVAWIDRLARLANEQIEAQIARDDELRRIYEIVDLVLAILRGSLRFNLASDPRGFDAIDGYDWREWLRLNGASERALHSSFLHSLYDLAFAYQGGDKSRPRASAAVALRCAVRAFLTYRGAFFWKMQAGMGDVVFAPLYEVLIRRGVRFEFFHRLERVALAPAARVAAGEPPWVEALEFDIQAEVKGGAQYAPLVDVKGLPCWPSEPDFSQLRDGDRLKADRVCFESHWDRRRVAARQLRVVDDFDFAVLAIGFAALPTVAGELAERLPLWRRAFDEVGTTATQAFQLWLREPVERLGWRGAPVNLTGVAGEFETWADMRQLIDREALSERPAAIAYFCSALDAPEPAPRDDSEYPAQWRARVRQAAIDFLDQRIAALWPDASGDAGFRFELLVDPAGGRRSDARAFDSQFWTANVDPSDRYVLSLPATSAARISPLDAGVDNLTVAGDWTACGLDVGCVEAAVMSGQLAAHAISGTPALSQIVGFDHP